MNKFLMLVAVTLVLSACGGGGAPASSSAPSGSQPAPAQEAPPVGAAKGGLTDNAAGGTAAQPDAAKTQQNFERLVIKTANMAIQVASVRETEAAIRARAAELGGYIVQSESHGIDEDLSMNIVFRVPVNRFEDALSGLQGMAKKVLSSTVGGEDVTEEYVDLESRRKTLEATRDRLLDLLTKAATVEDTIKLNESITEYQTQLDQIAGRVKYLSQSAAMSTITVGVTPVPALSPITPAEGWQPLNIARDSLRGLLEFGQGLATLGIVLLVWSPVWLVLGLVVVVAARRLRGAPKAKPTP